ncbi:MAG: LemA family protein [Actinobacteria bacterium]|nr:LemA family protein [Actinomycetota bacterium]
MYNRLVALRNRAEERWAQIDVQLTRRHDLIPNLVETVKGYAGHEREVLTSVTEARAAAVSAGSVGEQAQAEGMLTSALRSLFAVSEAYPQLQADQNFRELQTELARTEDLLAGARQSYNLAVREYDTALESFPTNIVGGMFNFEPREYFELADPAAASAPEVRF